MKYRLQSTSIALVAAASLAAGCGGAEEPKSPAEAQWRSGRPDKATLEVADRVENAPEALIGPEPTASAESVASARPVSSAPASGEAPPNQGANGRNRASGSNHGGSSGAVIAGVSAPAVPAKAASMTGNVPSAAPGLVRGKGDAADKELALADAAYARDNFAVALSHYRKARRLARDEPAPVVGVVMARLGLEKIPTEFAGAKRDRRVVKLLNLLDEARKLDPNYGPMLLQRGRLLLIRGDAAGALQALSQAAGRLPNNPEAHSALAVAQLAQGDVESALIGFRRASELEPANPERLTNLGTAYMMHGDVQNAISAYRSAVTLAPADPRARGDLGTALLATNNIRGAMPHLLEAQRLAPDKATFMSNLGYGYQQQGDLEAAVSWYEKAIQQDPKLGSAWINLGVVRADQGQFDEAKRAFRRALALDPTDPRAKANLKELKQAQAKARSAP